RRAEAPPFRGRTRRRHDHGRGRGPVHTDRNRNCQPEQVCRRSRRWMVLRSPARWILENRLQPDQGDPHRPHPCRTQDHRPRARRGRRAGRGREKGSTLMREFEFKPGNRVQQRDKDGILHRGTVDGVYDDCVYGTRDSGGRFVARPWHLTKIDDAPTEQEKIDALVQIACDDYPGPGLRPEDIQHRYGVEVGAFDAYYWFLTPEAVAALGEFTPVTQPTEADPAPLRFEDVRDGDTITIEGEDYSITGSSWTEPGDPPRVTVGGVTVFNFNGDEGTHGPYGPPVRLTAHTPAPAVPEWHRATVIMGCYTEAGTPEEPEYWLLGRDGLFYSVSGGAEDYELTNVTIIVDEYGEVRSA